MIREHFTREQVEEMRARLVGNAMRDTDFPEVESFTDTDSIAIVQNGKNRRLGVAKFIDEASKGITVRIGAGLGKDEDNRVIVKSASLSTDAVRIVVGTDGIKAEANIASAENPGVIKIGKRLSIDNNGALSADEQITAEEKKKIAAVRVIVADGTTIKEKELEDGSIQFSAVGGGTVNGLKIDDNDIPMTDDGTMHFELGKSLAFDGENNKLEVVWNSEV